MPRLKGSLGILCLTLGLLSACAGGPSGEPARKSGWAQPIRVRGVPNLCRVDDGLYRSAQFTAAGVAELKRLGIRTVVSLRSGREDEALLRGSGIRWVHLPVNTFFPRRDAFETFLRIAGDPQCRPLLVHCRHGSDRTGVAVALYRIGRQGWPAARANDEMAHGGTGFHPIHGHLREFVRGFFPRD